MRRAVRDDGFDGKIVGFLDRHWTIGEIDGVFGFTIAQFQFEWSEQFVRHIHGALAMIKNLQNFAVSIISSSQVGIVVLGWSTGVGRRDTVMGRG